MTTEEDRVFLYWMTNKIGGGGSATKFVYQNIHEMVKHDDRELIGDEGQSQQASKNLENINLSHENLNLYVYMCKTNGDADGNVNRITTMICDAQFYYLIDNHISTDGAIKSRIWFHVSPSSIGLLLPEDLVKYLDIKKFSAHLSKQDVNLLAGVLPLDFVRASHSEQSELWNRIMVNSTNSLDLSGLYNLSLNVITAEEQPHINTIIMNNNRKLNDLSAWLPAFPNLKVLSIWNNDIKDVDLVGVSASASLTIVEFHQCTQITGRCLLSLNRLPLLEKIIIDNEYCKLQETTYETVITDEEWKTIKSETIDTLFINSGNLTLDFIDFCLKSFSKITNFVIHEQMIPKLEKNSRSGHTEHKISFHSASNIDEGFYRYATVKITDLVRNKISPAFSESMLRKIRELDPSKTDIIDASM